MASITPTLATQIGSLVIAALSGLMYIRFWKTTQEKEIYTIKVLSKFFAFFTLFQLILGARILFPGLSQVQLTAFQLFAHIGFFISLAYFTKISTYIYKPEIGKYVFGGTLIFGAVAMYAMLNQWALITPLIAAPSIIVWIGLGTAVFYNLAREREGVERTKMLLMGTGFLIVALAGPLHGAAQTGTQLAAVEASTVLGIIAVAAGVYWKELLNSK
jgi:hypothetical protein